MSGIEKQLFNMKFTSKQLQRMSNKSQKDYDKELLKVKKAMEKGDQETARIYSENAIRIKNTGNNYLRLSSKLDAVASRLDSAIKMKAVTQQMGQVTKGMDKILASMDIAKISAVMEKFEASFDEVDMRTQCPRRVGKVPPQPRPRPQPCPADSDRRPGSSNGPARPFIAQVRQRCDELVDRVDDARGPGGVVAAAGQRRARAAVCSACGRCVACADGAGDALRCTAGLAGGCARKAACRAEDRRLIRAARGGCHAWGYHVCGVHSTRMC